ncbi:MAG: SAM-dependent DNA methyltransferase [Anaerolineae bacterium]
MTGPKSKRIREFGDFQTPADLAHAVTKLLRELGIRADVILEPTCGYGSFLAAAAATFPEAQCLVGFDINHAYVSEASRRLQYAPGAERIVVSHGDFYKIDWKSVWSALGAEDSRKLVLGNPPWVTNSELGLLQSENVPQKSNFQGHTGMEAITGKSNFDISEWMLLRYLDWLKGYRGTIAVLCKTAVARRILVRIWREKYPICSARLFSIDARKYFNVSVDASLFVLETGPNCNLSECDVFEGLGYDNPARKIGYYEDFLIADVARYQHWRHLHSIETGYVWRSGIKHDCSNVMELFRTVDGLWNRLGEKVDIEDVLLFPLLKGSDIGNGTTLTQGFMLVTQRSIGEDTREIQIVAPKTWKYLQNHAALFDQRASSIYRNRPPFSIFGVGKYSFTPWKVAIPGFYKRFEFIKVGPMRGRPAVFDDTVYFLPCNSEAEADFLCSLLNSTPAQEFYQSMVFWSDKRPITIQLLKRLNLRELARELGLENLYSTYTRTSGSGKVDTDETQLRLF